MIRYSALSFFLLYLLILSGCGAENQILSKGDELSSCLLESHDIKELRGFLSDTRDLPHMGKYLIFLPLVDKDYTYIDFAVQQPVLSGSDYLTRIDTVIADNLSEEYYDVSCIAVWTYSKNKWAVQSIRNIPDSESSK